MELFSVNTVFFEVLGYPMSYIEFFGTIFNLLSVWLISVRNRWTFSTGLVGVSLFIILFYQIRLYADFFEQIYYAITLIYGWILWSKAKEQEDGSVKVGFSSWRFAAFCIAGCIAFTAVWTFLMQNLHLWLPTLFPDPASYPFIDSFTTVLSFVAMLLMMHRRTECWIYWTVVNVISIWLYYVKEVKFVALLVCVYLCLGLYGLYKWLKADEIKSAEINHSQLT